MIGPVLDQIDTLLASLPGVEGQELAHLAPPARERALALADSVPEPEAVRLGGRAYAAELVSGLALGRTWAPTEVRALVAPVARAAGIAPAAAELEVYLDAAKQLAQTDLPPRLALRSHLRVLAGFAPVEDVSFWTMEHGRAPRCVVFVGEGEPTRRIRATARELLSGRPERPSERGFVHGVPVLRWQRPWGALVLRARPRDRERALVFAREAAIGLAAAVERSLLLERGVSRERTLVEASERRVVRLGFDIHDGPIQDVIALADDVRLFRTQLERGLSSGSSRELLVGRIDDFEARLIALDRELRELAHSLERSSTLERPFAEVLRRQVAAFTTRNDVTVRLDVRGNLAELTKSQRLAIVAVVREALTNVRDHSGASEAAISLSVGRTRTLAAIVDNGRGFEVEGTLVDAARRGRLGLVGMSERIRLLGGRLELQSRRGGPTRIEVTIPRWAPLELDVAGARAS